MQVECPSCHEIIEIPFSIQDGQHVMCPYCERKFAYEGKLSKPAVIAAWLDRFVSFVIAHKKVAIVAASSIVGMTIILSILTLRGVFEKNTVVVEGQSVDPMTCPFGGFDICDAQGGKAYIHKSPSMIVEHVVPKKGVLVTDGQKTFYIETDRLYVDGAVLLPTLYTCVGRAVVSLSTGVTVTLVAFREVEEKMAKQRIQVERERMIAEDLARKKAEEEARKKKEEEEMLDRAAKAKAEEELKQLREKNERELEEKRAEQRRLLEQKRIEQERKDELDRIEREKKEESERLERERKSAEEARKRYPIEQKQRAEYAAIKFSKLNFDYRSRLHASKTVKDSLLSCQINEARWEELHDMICRKEWLKVLSAVTGSEMTDYPDIQRIDAALVSLMEIPFHLEMKFKYERQGYFGPPVSIYAYAYSPIHVGNGEVVYASGLKEQRRWKIDEVDSLFDRTILPPCTDVQYDRGRSDSMTVLFKVRLKDDFKILLFDNVGNGVADASKSLGAKIEVLRHDLSTGKIENMEFDESVGRLYQEYLQKVLDRASPMYSSAKSSSAKDVATHRKKASARVPCEACAGKRYIREECPCSRCNGTGRTFTPAKKMISGWSKPRESSCDTCQGKGTISRSKCCPACKGKGTVRQ